MPYRAPTLTEPDAPTRRRRGLAAAALALGATAGGAWAVRRGPSHAEVGAVSPAPARPPWPGRAHPWTAHRDERGGREVVYGPLRFVIGADDAIEVAAVRFEATILAAVPTTSGWVFVTADGAVAASETFLGGPRPLGRFGCAFKVAPDPVGRAVLLGADGSLWSTDGSTPLQRSHLPGEARAATFVDARRGAVVLRDGRVLVTADAGRRWEFHPLAPDAAWSVAPARGGVVLETTRGREPIRWDEAASPDEARPSRAPEPRAVEDRLRAYINRRDERFTPSGILARCTEAPVVEPRPSPPGHRYRCRSDRALRPVTLLPLPYQSSVDATDLLTGTESGPVRARFWRRRPDATGETFVRVRWMDIDAQGPFHGMSSATGRGLDVHWPIEQRGPLRVVAVSRGGALVLTHDRPGEPVLAWGTAARPFVRVRDGFVERALAGTRSFAAPAPDGGAIVSFAATPFEAARDTWSGTYAEVHPLVGAAMHLDAHGAVVARRGFISEGADALILARAGDLVGPLLRDAAEPARWRVLPLEGDGAAAIPAIAWDRVSACGPERGDGLALTVAYPPIALAQVGAREALVVSRAELEATADGGLCARALSLGGRRLTAAPGDRFVGALRCEPDPAPPPRAR